MDDSEEAASIRLAMPPAKVYLPEPLLANIAVLEALTPFCRANPAPLLPAPMQLSGPPAHRTKGCSERGSVHLLDVAALRLADIGRPGRFISAGPADSENERY
jgi:hypothetical protein